MRNVLTVIGLSSCLLGCAELPPKAVVGYYLPKARIQVTATETIACEGANHVTATFDVKPSISYFADTTQRRSFSFNDFSNAFNDMDMTVDLTNDGRLQTINATETGEAKEIASAASL